MRSAYRHVACLLALTLGTVVLSAPALAGDVYGTGFESPTFTTGSLDEQDGWVATTETTVTNAQAASGSQSVAITLTSNGYTGQYHTKASRSVDDPTATNDVVTVSQSVMLSDLGEADWQIAVLGSFVVTNTVTFQYDGDILLNNVDTGVNWTAGVWKTVTLVLDFSAHKAALYYGGSLIAENITFHNSTVGFDKLVLATDDYVDEGSTMYYDNLSISAVPEPATTGLLAFGLVALAMRRSRQRKA